MRLTFGSEFLALHSHKELSRTEKLALVKAWLNLIQLYVKPSVTVCILAGVIMQSHA